MILQTSVKISIFLQDRYNPIAHGILGWFFELRLEASGVGILPQQYSWWWRCGLSVSFFFFFFSPQWWWTGPTTTLLTYKLAIRLFNLETWCFVLFLSCWWHTAKIYGQEAIGFGPHLEFYYKVALLIETAVSSEENFACCLTGCCLWISPFWQKTKQKTTTCIQMENYPFVQECSAVLVCLMISTTNCLSYPLFDFAALALFCSRQKKGLTSFLIWNHSFW